MLGERIAARYEVVREDQGGFAYDAFRAIDHEIEVEVAIWLVKADLLTTEADRRMFCADAVRARAVSHPHLRRVFDAGVHAGRCYVTMQPLDAPTLAERLDDPADDAEVARLGIAIAEGLAAGHAGNLVHGRLVPPDILLLDGTPRVSGMGLWRALDAKTAAMAWGPLERYLPPEVEAGERVGPAADVYALGAILGDLALGTQGISHSPLVERLRQERPRAATALVAGLAGDPAARPTLPEFTRALQQLAAPPSDTEDAATRHYLSLDKTPAPSPDDFPDDEVADAPTPAPVAPRARSAKRRAPEPEEPETIPPWRPPERDPDEAIPTLRAGAVAPVPPPPSSSEWVATGENMPTNPAPAVPPASPPPVELQRKRPATVVPPPSGSRNKIALYAAAGVGLLIVGAGIAWLVATLARDDAKPQAAAPVHPDAAPAAPRTADAAPDPMQASALDPCPRGAKLVAGPPSFCIDAHEAPGEGFTPVTGITLDKAREACVTHGKRLCTADEWESACRGPGGQSWPYGAAYLANRCNVKNRGGLAPGGSYSECVSAAGVHDMSGNAAEWIDDGTTRGGSALDGSDGRCSRVTRRRAGSSPRDVGYRCCATPGTF